MIKPENHKNEKERLELLNSYSILDTLPEVDYDNLTVLASAICNTPISLVSLLDSNRQWFKSHYGLEATETPKDFAFCGHAINQSENIFIIPDARIDERFHDNPLVVGKPKIVFYAGVVLKDNQNLPLGTICVIDHKPHVLSQNQIKMLVALSSQVMNLLELRRSKALLVKAIEELEEKNSELEKFAYIVAHDLKSPLNNICALTHLLSEDYSAQLDEDGQQIIELLLHSSTNLKRLVDGLLECSISAKIIAEVKEIIHLESLKEEIAALFSFEKKLEITLNSPLENIYVNRTAIEQILINLIGNAIKYNDKEKTKIELNVIENDREFRINVIDNGPGILKENHVKIFQIFETLTEQDKYGNSNNGIGLATVKKLVERLGGQIEVESEIGKGSNFSFFINK